MASTGTTHASGHGHGIVHQAGSFRDLKKLLSEMDTPNDEETEMPMEIKKRTHMLCSRYLGGAWKRCPVELLRLTRMTGGMSNMLFLCRLPETYPPERGEPNKTLMRVYFNPETETHLVAESVIFTLLSERHLGPRLYGLFNGGRLEEYIPSRPLTCAEIRQPVMSKKIASRVAKIHQLDVPITKDPEYLSDAIERWLNQLSSPRSEVSTPINKNFPPNAFSEHQQNLDDVVGSPPKHHGQQQHHQAPLVHPQLNRIRSTASTHSNTYEIDISGGDVAATTGLSPEKKRTIRVTLDDLYREAAVVKRCISASRSPIVFCHNDLQEGNILLPRASSGNIRMHSLSEDSTFLGPPGTPRLVVIDFEYASYNYRAFDFANHFCEWTIDYTNPEAPYYYVFSDKFPTRDQQRHFYQSYLEAMNVSGNLESQADAMVDECEGFVAVSHFFWGIWSLLQVEVSPVAFGFADYGRMRLANYFKLKPRLLKLLKGGPTGSESGADDNQSTNISMGIDKDIGIMI